MPTKGFNNELKAQAKKLGVSFDAVKEFCDNNNKPLKAKAHMVTKGECLHKWWNATPKAEKENDEKSFGACQ